MQKYEEMCESVLFLNYSSFWSGGWWNIDKFDDITGPVAIEMSPMQYVEALDNGLFRLGRKHDIGEQYILSYCVGQLY